MKHSSIGPSAASRWLNCPGSVRLCAGLTKRPPGKFAEEGTAAHKLAELVLTGELDSLDQALGKVMAKTPEGWQLLPPELASAYSSKFPAHINTLDAVRVYTDYAVGLGGMRRVEQTFDLGPKGLPGVFGMNDCAVYLDDVVHVLDYKHGANEPVEVEENPQLMLYALGVVANRPGDKVVLTIVQPRCPHRDGPVRKWETTVDYLYAWAEKIVKPAIKAVNDPNSPLVPGEKQCRWCEAARQAVCPEVAKSISRSTGIDLLAPIPASPALPEPRLLTREDKARILLLEPILLQWLDAIRETALEEAKTGTTFPGLKLVHKITRRKYKDEAQAASVLAPLYGDDIWETKLKSPSQIEKIGGKAAKETLGMLTESPVGDLTLVSESDRRKAVNPLLTLAPLFDDL